jgi:hypothetical protein
MLFNVIYFNFLIKLKLKLRLLITAALISEFSPFLLHNYIVSYLPFLTSYSGRSLVYFS